MSKITSRIYGGRVDLQSMIKLIQELRACGQTVYPIAADLYEELADAQVQAATRLWERDENELVGFAYVSRYQNLVDVFDARVSTVALESEMIDWAAQIVRLRNQTQGEDQTLDASTLEGDLKRLAFLEGHGFERLGESSLLMARPLDQAIPDPVLPAGFTIRPMQGEPELVTYVNLHRAAFGTENMTLDYRRSIMSTPDYQPELDLVAVAPNGELAAFCMGQIFPDDAPRAGGQKEGWTDPMGTHPQYQRQGLARALMLTGMRLLQERGVDTALLGTSSQNLAMQRAAESVGFTRISNTLWYARAIR
jgi:ribosomal protein S18 acetylase RimI-like enzyme